MPASPEPHDEPRFFGRGARAGDVVAERYRVLGELGAGGMGQVVEVEHTELEKRFALKLIRPDRWDAALEARFRREAKALARVDSPRVAQVTDFGVSEEHGPFYVMELIQGRPLDRVIREEGPLERAHALELAIGIAEALTDVHEAGIVHRDIKPGNIGVCDRGPIPVRLLDFGLATAMDDQLGSRITESRRVIGSFPYMAPEQFHGETPSTRIDVWALGVVLYEMLCSELPFEAPSTAALIHQILAVDVPMRHPAPRRCKALLGRLLAKDPNARPADAGEALVLLEEALAQPETEGRPAPSVATAEATVVDTGSAPGPRDTPPPSPAPATRLWLGAALALLGLAGLLGAWRLSDRSATPPDATPAPREAASAPTERAGEPASSAPDAPQPDAPQPDAPQPDAPQPDAPQPDAPSPGPGPAGALADEGAVRADESPAPPPRLRRPPRSARDRGASRGGAEAGARAEGEAETETEAGRPTTADEPTPDEGAPGGDAETAPAWTGDIIEAPSP